MGTHDKGVRTLCFMTNPSLAVSRLLALRSKQQWLISQLEEALTAMNTNSSNAMVTATADDKSFFFVDQSSEHAFQNTKSDPLCTGQEVYTDEANFRTKLCTRDSVVSNTCNEVVYRQETEQLKARLASRDLELATWMQRVAMAEVRLRRADESDAEMKRLTSELENISCDRDRLETELQISQSKLVCMEKDSEEMRSRYQSVAVQLLRFEETGEATERTLLAAVERQDQLEGQVRDGRGEVARLELLLQGARMEKAAEEKKAHLQMVDFERSQQALGDELNRVRTEYESLVFETAARVAAEKAAEFQAEKESREHEMHSLREALQAQRTDLASMSAELESCRAELQSKSSALAKAAGDLLVSTEEALVLQECLTREQDSFRAARNRMLEEAAGSLERATRDWESRCCEAVEGRSRLQAELSDLRASFAEQESELASLRLAREGGAEEPALLEPHRGVRTGGAVEVLPDEVEGEEHMMHARAMLHNIIAEGTQYLHSEAFATDVKTPAIEQLASCEEERNAALINIGVLEEVLESNLGVLTEMAAKLSEAQLALRSQARHAVFWREEAGRHEQQKERLGQLLAELESEFHAARVAQLRQRTTVDSAAVSVTKPPSGAGLSRGHAPSSSSSSSSSSVVSEARLTSARSNCRQGVPPLQPACDGARVEGENAGSRSPRHSAAAAPPTEGREKIGTARPEAAVLQGVGAPTAAEAEAFDWEKERAYEARRHEEELAAKDRRIREILAVKSQLVDGFELDRRRLERETGALRTEFATLQRDLEWKQDEIRLLRQTLVEQAGVEFGRPDCPSDAGPEPRRSKDTPFGAALGSQLLRAFRAVIDAIVHLNKNLTGESAGGCLDSEGLAEVRAILARAADSTEEEVRDLVGAFERCLVVLALNVRRRLRHISESPAMTARLEEDEVSRSESAIAVVQLTQLPLNIPAIADRHIEIEEPALETNSVLVPAMSPLR